MIEDELRSVAWHLPIGFDTAKNTAFRACDEIARLRLRAAEADALRAEREQWGKDFSALMDQIAHLDDVLNDTDECEAWSGCADISEQFDPWESIRVMVETAKTLRATVAAQAKTIETARKIITQLAPNEPMNQDEVGGCVWCGGHPRGKPYGYATSNPKHHSEDCAWIIARAWLAAHAQTPTTGETEYINAFAAIDKVMTEHPELFANDGAQSETESDIAQRLQDAVDKHADEIARIE